MSESRALARSSLPRAKNIPREAAHSTRFSLSLKTGSKTRNCMRSVAHSSVIRFCVHSMGMHCESNEKRLDSTRFAPLGVSEERKFPIGTINFETRALGIRIWRRAAGAAALVVSRCCHSPQLQHEAHASHLPARAQCCAV